MEPPVESQWPISASNAQDESGGVAGQARPALLLRVKRRRDAAAPEEMILQQSSIKRSREDKLAAQLAALMSHPSDASAAGAAQAARRRCRFTRVQTVGQGAVMGRSANDLVQLMQAPEFQGKQLHEVLQLLEQQETMQQQQQQQLMAPQTRATFTAAAPLGTWDDTAHARPSNQPGVQYMQLPRVPTPLPVPGSSDAAPSAQHRPLQRQQQQQQGTFRLYDLVQVESLPVRRLVPGQSIKHPGKASMRDSSATGLAADYESLLQEYLSTQQQRQQQERQGTPVATPSPRLKPPRRRRAAQPTSQLMAPSTQATEATVSTAPPVTDQALGFSGRPEPQLGQAVGRTQPHSGAQQAAQGWRQWQEEEEYVYDVYLAIEGLWTEVLPAEAMEADEEGVPVVEVLTDDEDLLALPPGEVPDPDHDSEDSNAESFYANSYPDEDPYGDAGSSEEERDEEGYYGDADRGHGVPRVPIYGGADEEEFDAEEYEEEELQAAMMPGQLWRSRLLQS